MSFSLQTKNLTLALIFQASTRKFQVQDTKQEGEKNSFSKNMRRGMFENGVWPLLKEEEEDRQQMALSVLPLSFCCCGYPGPGFAKDSLSFFFFEIWIWNELQWQFPYFPFTSPVKHLEKSLTSKNITQHNICTTFTFHFHFKRIAALLGSIAQHENRLID